MSDPTPEKQLRAIAQCCLNSATMLRIADESTPRDPRKLKAIQELNRKQAHLLVEAARMAEQLAEARS